MIDTKLKSLDKDKKKHKTTSKKYILNIFNKKAKKSISLQIDPDWTMSYLDEQFRILLKYELSDHCSSFDFGKGIFRTEVLITPDGDGENSWIKFSKLQLEDKEYFTYIYDLGDYNEYIVQLIIQS